MVAAKNWNYVGGGFRCSPPSWVFQFPRKPKILASLGNWKTTTQKDYPARLGSCASERCYAKLRPRSSLKLKFPA